MTDRALLIEGASTALSSHSDYLTARGLEVFHALTAAEAIPLLDAVRPDVTALDMGLPGADAAELIPAIRRAGSLCVVMTETDGPQERLRLLSRGVDDIIPKPFETEELYLRARNMLSRRRTPASFQEAATVDLSGVRIDLVSRAILGPDGPTGVELTASELATLRLLADNIDKLVSTDALRLAGRGEDAIVAPRTLDVALSRLRVKLRKAGAPVELHCVRRAGYMLSRA